MCPGLLNNWVYNPLHTIFCLAYGQHFITQSTELCNFSVFDTRRIFLSSSFPTQLEISGSSLINQMPRTLLSLFWLYLQLSQQYDNFYSPRDSSSFKSTWSFVFLILQLCYRHLLIQKFIHLFIQSDRNINTQYSWVSTMLNLWL